MKRWDIPFSPTLPSRIEPLAATLGLTCTLRTTLATLPGSLHWHFKRGKEKGVVEFTTHNATAWINVQSGRSSATTLQLAQSLADVLTDLPREIV